jgi:hypothetical protein
MCRPENNSAHRDFRALIVDMPERQRWVSVLRFVAGLSRAEMALVLGNSASDVKSDLWIAIRKIMGADSANGVQASHDPCSENDQPTRRFFPRNASITPKREAPQREKSPLKNPKPLPRQPSVVIVSVRHFTPLSAKDPPTMRRGRFSLVDPTACRFLDRIDRLSKMESSFGGAEKSSCRPVEFPVDHPRRQKAAASSPTAQAIRSCTT